MIIGTLLAAVVQQPPKEEIINQFCSIVVGVPYQSDDMTNDQWQRYTFCMEHLE